MRGSNLADKIPAQSGLSPGRFGVNLNRAITRALFYAVPIA
jgi:hypothetical protein